MSDDYLLSLWRSWAHPSPSGDGGAATVVRGRSRPAGPSFGTTSRVPHPSSPAARHMMPGELERLHAQEALEGLLHRLLSQSKFSQVQRLARQILGADSFGLGVCYGLISYPAQEVGGLLELGQVFVLADLHDQVCAPLSASSFVGPTAGTALFMRGLFAFGEAMWLQKRLAQAHQKRELMFRELKSIMDKPADFFVGLPAKLQEGYQERWRHFLVLQRGRDLRSQFEAGKIFGELLMEVLMTLAALVAMGATVVKLGAKAPQLLKAAQRLRPRNPGSNVARASEVAAPSRPAAAQHKSSAARHNPSLATELAQPATKSPLLVADAPLLHPDVIAQLDSDARGVHGWLPKQGSQYGKQRTNFTDPEYVARNRAIRQKYLQGSKDLERDIARMRAEGRSPEEIGRHVVDARNQQKVEARALMPPDEAKLLEQRNMERYENPVGPTADEVAADCDGDWEQVIEKSMKKDPVINTLLGLEPNH